MGTHAHQGTGCMRPALIGVGLVMVAACGESEPRMELTGVTPSEVRSDQDTSAAIEGRHFRNAVRVQLDDTKPAKIARGWTFTVPGTDVAQEDAELIDAATLAVVIPAGLPLGTYDVRVRAPSGQSSQLEDAFTVVADLPGSGGEGGSGQAGATAVAGSAGQAGAGGIGGSGVLGPFGSAEAIPALQDQGTGNDDPCFTADLLELYFSSNRPGGVGSHDIWVSRRTTPSEPWGAPEPVVELNSSASDSFPAVSADGLSMWLSSARAGSVGDLDLWHATRATRSSPWSPPEHVPELCSPAEEASSHVSEGGLRMVFASNRFGGAGSRDLYESTRASTTSTWDAPIRIAELSTPALETDPRLFSDGLQIIYTTNWDGAADRDLLVAARPSLSAPFGAPLPVVSLNTNSWESDAWLSEDLSYIVFSSDRTGSEQIYQAWQ